MMPRATTPTVALLVGFFCLFLIVLPVQAQPKPLGSNGEEQAADADVFVPNVLPSLTIPRLTTAIKVDGDLSDAGWRNAARAVNFSETFPGDQAKPSIDVTAYLAYDDDHLYIAYVLEDDPAQIRANMSDRDQHWNDDYVGMLLDPTGDGQATYFIAANPLGIQGDTFITPNNEDVGFNLLFTSEGQTTSTGYQVEMAIPFKSLRFPNTAVQTWRATFWITHPRESRNTYSWAAVDRDNPCWTCQFGTFQGISRRSVFL
jgi:hypothetical protein